MKVRQLEISNVRRVKHVIITPSGWVVRVTGPNKNGKTSTLDALRYLLEGTRDMPDNVLHEGAKKGFIEGDFGDITITRKITEKGTYLEVIDKDGNSLGQKFLDECLGKNATDCMTFLSKTKAEQRKLLATLSGADTAAIDAEIRQLEQKRTDTNRLWEQFQALVVGKSIIEGLPEEETPALEALGALQKAKDANKALTDLTRAHQNTTELIGASKAEIKRLQERLDDLELQFASEEMEISTGKMIDIAPLEVAITNLEETNRKVRENIALIANKKILRNKADLAEKAKEELETARANKLAIIAAAKFPVPGLGIDDDGVLLNGRPLEESSEAERILVCLSIVSKLLPKDGIRILRVGDGEKIGRDMMAELEVMAEREQVQIWIEIMKDEPGAKGGVGTEIFIQDGCSG